MSDFNPATMTLAEIVRRLAAIPFLPFVLLKANGDAFLIPTPDHCTVMPYPGQVSIDRDDGSAVIIHLLQVTAIEEAPASLA